MSQSEGKFVWCELLTTDAPAAIAFYTTVVGWAASDFDMPGGTYTILDANQTHVAGIMDLPQAARDSGARPLWMGYIAVDDVDATIPRVTAAGGTLHRPAADIPGVGRFAVVADPQGAPFTLFTPAPSDAPPPPPASSVPGHIGWYELHATDLDPAFAFYETLFGWTRDHAIDMGPMGTYQLFAAGSTTIGGMMTKSPAAALPGWLFYINVPDIHAAVARAKAAGGQLLNGPMEVPGGSWVAQCIDPQGAAFAMVKPAA